MSQITLNPSKTTVATGSFGIQSTGWIQGTAVQDPAVRFALSGGLVGPNEAYPMWGGLACSLSVAPVSGAALSPQTALGGYVTRATQVASGSTGGAAGDLMGWTVFDQVHSMISTPQSEVPLAASGMMINFYRLGSGARIPVKCDPALIDLFGDPITVATAWDFENGLLVPYTGAKTVSSGTYNGGTGLVTLTLASAANLSPGDSVIVSGATGTGSFAAINGTFTAGAGTGGSTVTYTIATGLTLTITGGSLTTGAVLPVRVLSVQGSGNMTVDFDPTTGFATWDRNGAIAEILI